MGKACAVLFDLGNTLYRDVGIYEAVHRALERLGLGDAPRIEAVYRALGFRVDDLCEASMEAAAALYLALSGQRPSPDRVSELYQELARGMAEGARLLPEAPGVLEKLRGRGYRIGLVSNASSHEAILHVLRRDGLLGLFDAVVTSRLLGVRKPDPRIFHYALMLLGVEPGRAVYVGNRAYEDVYGARRAGLRAIHVLVEGEAPSLLADAATHSLGEVPRLVDELLGDACRGE